MGVDGRIHPVFARGRGLLDARDERHGSAGNRVTPCRFAWGRTVTSSITHPAHTAASAARPLNSLLAIRYSKLGIFAPTLNH
jgi:hypothetical protein